MILIVGLNIFANAIWRKETPRVKKRRDLRHSDYSTMSYISQIERCGKHRRHLERDTWSRKRKK